MASEPLISVCVISYNHAPYLGDFFNSLLEQTYQNLEVIFVDDQSPDDSFDVARSFEHKLSARFPRVVIERNSVNSGMHVTGQVAADLATGEYICNMDGDDYYLPDRVRKCSEFLSMHPDIDAVHSDYFRVQDGKLDEVSYWESQPPQTVISPAVGWAYEKLLVANTIAHLTLMMRADCYRLSFRRHLYKDRQYMMTDYPSILTMSKLTPIGYIDETLACYRILANSASNSVERKAAFKASAAKIRQDARLGLL
jgi:glycosyltransferase involved in cell wall biosynthesis